jgi:hypothetical protein
MMISIWWLLMLVPGLRTRVSVRNIHASISGRGSLFLHRFNGGDTGQGACRDHMNVVFDKQAKNGTQR